MTLKNKFERIPDGSVTTPAGFRACGLHSGIKKTDRYDLGAIHCEVPAEAAAVFTLNLVQAAPLYVTKDSLAVNGKLQAVVVNSGNANACTGDQGLADAYEMRTATAKALGIHAEHHVAVASTGVIGELMPMEKVLAGITQFPQKLVADGGDDFSQAIQTTDLVEKKLAVSLTVDGKTVHIGGVAKGSGMIQPNMATMLAFLTTDANISSSALQQLLSDATDQSFNMITVDGDTSTNDMALVMASGKAENKPLEPGHPDWEAFSAAFCHVSEYLAKAIARDGEGATKLVEVRVNGAQTEEAAKKIAKTVIGSSLVKSAVFGADANWGRVIAAAGRADAPMNPNTVDIRIGDIQVLEQSRPLPFDDDAATEYMKTEDTIVIEMDLHDGDAQAVGWGCDLTYEYVRINAAYRT